MCFKPSLFHHIFPNMGSVKHQPLFPLLRHVKINIDCNIIFRYKAYDCICGVWENTFFCYYFNERYKDYGKIFYIFIRSLCLNCYTYRYFMNFAFNSLYQVLTSRKHNICILYVWKNGIETDVLSNCKFKNYISKVYTYIMPLIVLY